MWSTGMQIPDGLEDVKKNDRLEPYKDLEDLPYPDRIWFFPT